MEGVTCEVASLSVDLLRSSSSSVLLRKTTAFNLEQVEMISFIQKVESLFAFFFCLDFECLLRKESDDSKQFPHF